MTLTNPANWQNVPKLYHFCEAHTAPLIRREGLTLGCLVWPVDSGFSINRGFQWLTDDPAWQQQGWATTRLISNDRTAVRFTVKIPTGDRHLIPWHALARQLRFPPEQVRLFDDAGGGGGDHWWCYVGAIPRTWLRHETARPDLPGLVLFTPLG